MATAVPPRESIATEYTWNTESIFPTVKAWEDEFSRLEGSTPELERFRGRLGEGPATLLEWLNRSEQMVRTLQRLIVYAASNHNVNTADPEAEARNDRVMGLYARLMAATSFDSPEILAIGLDTLRRWETEEPQLEIFDHYFEVLESSRPHIRTTEVEEILGLVQDPFSNASSVHATLTDTDLTFAPARSQDGAEIEIAQGNIARLLSDSDRQTRRTAWEHYADAHLSFKNTIAGCISSGVKQDVFRARARRYGSSLEASMGPSHIPPEVFHNLIATYRRNLPVWHRYWKVRKLALGYDTFHPYDVKAPLTGETADVTYSQSVEWIVEGMRPLGDEYVEAMRRGLVEERWVDVYPNQGKRSGAYSTGTPDTYPLILMSYNDDLLSMSTLAHELGHSMHSYLSARAQPYVYTGYGLFVAEVASNFNQALVRAYLLASNSDPQFQIAVIEEAMSNFHRYFFIMPALARFELEIHERVERGEALSADSLITLMAQLFQEGYGNDVEVDEQRVGITWAQFPIHMYLNFYVYQYATGISAAQALSQRVLQGGREAAKDYLAFLEAGGSVYPLDALKLAGVDMTSPEPVQRAFDDMAAMVERLAQLTGVSD